MKEDRSSAGSITVQQFFKFGASRLSMNLVAGSEGLGKKITNYRVQRTGLALAGFYECAARERVHILGATEMQYLERLSQKKRAGAISSLLACDLACMVITGSRTAPEYLSAAAERSGTALFTCPLENTQAIDLITHFLDLQLSPRASLHGSLLDIYGLGVLLIGESSAGKSEAALELVAKGHRLVADDVVQIQLVENEALVGTGPEEIRYLMELRGIGLIDIKDLFGVGAVRESKKIELVVRLERWREDEEYTRLGTEEKTYTFLGIEVPYDIIPVAPGRNLAILIEVAARNQLLKLKGVNIARRVSRRLDRRLRRKGGETKLRDIAKESVGLFE